jgi:hypothetical protein
MMSLRKRSAPLVLAATVLVLAGSAFGYTAGRIFTVRAGDGADFPLKSGRWSCNNNHGNAVACFSGDAFPRVDLTGSRRGGVTVKVYTLPDPGGGQLRRMYTRRGRPVYVFTAS